MSLIGDISDPQKDAAALQPVVDKAISELVTGAAQQIAPALESALTHALDGLQIVVTIQVTRKPGT